MTRSKAVVKSSLYVRGVILIAPLTGAWKVF